MRLLVFAALLVTIISTVFWWHRQASDTRMVGTITVDPGSMVSSLLLTGELVNDRSVIITALVDGEITAVTALKLR